MLTTQTVRALQTRHADPWQSGPFALTAPRSAQTAYEERLHDERHTDSVGQWR